MQEPDLISLFVRPLEKARMRYLVACSVGAMHYSEPHLTLDVDIPILVMPIEIQTLTSLFPDPEYYCPPADLIASEIARDCRGHFNVNHIPTGLKADVYPGKRDATLSWGWSYKLIEQTSEGPISIASPEYIILWKLIFYKDGRSKKHLRDIQRMLETQSDGCFAPCKTEYPTSNWRTILTSLITGSIGASRLQGLNFSCGWPSRSHRSIQCPLNYNLITSDCSRLSQVHTKKI